MPQQKSDPKPSSFHSVLQDAVSVSDIDWRYHVPDLPSAAKLNHEGYIKVVALETRDGRHQIIIRLQKASPNRGISGESLDKFIVVSVSSFRPLPCHGSERTTNINNQPGTSRECTDYVVKLLCAGVSIQGVHYNFYGHSNSQLKSRTCILFAASKEEITKKVNELGDFSKLKTVQKKAKRIGLLFSETRAAMDIRPERCEDIPDIETADYNFTDGCGLISPRLAQDLARRMRIIHQNTRYTPSVFQIRYRGYKGVLMVDPAMKGKTWIKFRKSMKKFSGGDDLSFAVVEYSKPYRFGHLNNEVILLLHSLGISSDTLLRKQAEYFSFLNAAVNDARTAFQFLTYINEHLLAERLIMESFDEVKAQVLKLVNQEYSKLVKDDGKRKTRIMIKRSRLVFGICDAWGVLKDGECAVKITSEIDGVPRALKGTEILVTRNPCWHPGDLQKLKVVEKDELAHLVDCIVFPTRGRRPPADMMSGGDLDGDTFFVCWDPDLIPSTVSQPADYPGAKEPVAFKPITDQDRLEYFARYNDGSMGRLKVLHMRWARAKGPMSAECQELNRLYSTCVDGNRINIAPRLREPSEVPPEAPPFILDELHEAAGNARRPQSESGNDSGSYDFDAMELLLTRDNVAMSEFELIRLLYRWCSENSTPFADFVHLFDFNMLTSEEKTWVLALPPPNELRPSLVRNALCQSSLLEVHELTQFKLHDEAFGWKRIYDSSHERLASFPENLSNALETFHRKLVVFRVDERLTLAMYIPRKIETSSETRVDDAARLFAFPHSRGHEKASQLSRPTKKNYHIYCDDNMFQLYDGKRANTWVYMCRSRGDDSRYRNIERPGDRRRARNLTLKDGENYDCRCSVALDKFGRGLQTHIGRVNRNGILGAEIYVISNRDVKSMQSLDLWLEYIDTAEVLPLFDPTPREYALPTLDGVDWSSLPDYITAICKDHILQALDDLELIDQYETVFSFLLDYGQNDTLVPVFGYMMDKFVGGDPVELLAPPSRRDILRAMLDCLARSPRLAVGFTGIDSDDMAALPEDLATTLEAHGPEILTACILSASSMQDLIITPFKRVLARTRSMTLRNFADLVKLVSLTIRSPDLAMDLLLDCLERQSERLLAASPGITQHYVRCLIGIALDHIGEAAEQGQTREDLLQLRRLPEAHEGRAVVEADIRIDAKGGTPEQSAHVRLTAASESSNKPLRGKYSMDALVLGSQQGKAKFQCLHPPPPFLAECSWLLEYLGLYTMTQTMFDAVVKLANDRELCCGIVDLIIPESGVDAGEGDLERVADLSVPPMGKMNDSQKLAISTALDARLTCLWGPPGTGKTSTIVEILKQLLFAYPKARILVTAPTHNAVDNVMQRYLDYTSGNEQFPGPLRVSTEVRKVSEALRIYTCDAMAGAEIHSSFAARKAAEKRIKASRLIFTTCGGAGLGLLRKRSFDIVIIDEASQQTEPASLVPLVKGCQKAILVGDHVQLRPTVTKHAAAQGFDVSLFERLYTAETNYTGRGGVKKVMLDTQYRMHAAICKFSSDEFYNSALKTGVSADARPLLESMFPWPPAAGLKSRDDVARMVFVDCSSKEDLGHKSKSNSGQTKLCLQVCKLLRTAKSNISAKSPTAAGGLAGQPDDLANQFIAVLTPYTRQVEVLKRELAGISNLEVCSIDGFQGREADVVVFVTVRCNEHGVIGFLTDLRRLNVAMTRAKCGVVVIGNRATLTMAVKKMAAGRGLGAAGGVNDGEEEVDSDYERVWRGFIGGMPTVKVEADLPLITRG
ncbi:RNA dependent RNA polymerase domain containing protein [Rhypophila sp. PSN 637]